MDRKQAHGVDGIIIGAGSGDYQGSSRSCACRLSSGCGSLVPTFSNGDSNALNTMIDEPAKDLITTATNIEIHAFGTR